MEKDQIAEYTNKLDHLLYQFTSKVTFVPDPLAKTKALFDWLWEEKPTRYKPHGNYRLNHVIDAQISHEIQTVGNCLGLTLLYNCLLRRMGIVAEALYLEEAFGIGPHVLTIIPTRDSSIDVENILPDGYDYQGHLMHPSRTRWRDQELIADIYLSMGNDLFEEGKWIEALRKYDHAIYLNPQFEKAYLNRAILLNKVGSEGKQDKNGS